MLFKELFGTYKNYNSFGKYIVLKSLNVVNELHFIIEKNHLSKIDKNELVIPIIFVVTVTDHQ